MAGGISTHLIQDKDVSISLIMAIGVEFSYFPYNLERGELL
jgi:hypothetical protein